MPTLLDLAGNTDILPTDIDGISLAPTLINRGKQKESPYLYMEFPAYGGQQMLRRGKWKAVRQNLKKEPDAPIELYNLDEDIAEEKDVSKKYPEIVAELWNLMKNARSGSKEFPFPALDDQIVPRILDY